jgi:hypothetical protein
MTRGVLYIVWGEKVEPLLQRSMSSVRKFYPDMPIEIVRGVEDPVRGLAQKSKMATQSPFESTLFLDADTVVLGNLDYAFERAEEFGLACAICECPWLRRYGKEEGDQIEYKPARRAAAGCRAMASFADWNMTINPASHGPCENVDLIHTYCLLTTIFGPDFTVRSSRR